MQALKVQALQLVLHMAQTKQTKHAENEPRPLTIGLLASAA